MLLFRFFECAIVDWNMENEIFESLSDQGIGPKLYYQNDVYRIEGFFLSRPLTIFEMRNDIFMEVYARKICDFNHNQKARERVLKYLPLDKLYVDVTIDKWLPELIEKMPEIKEAYKAHPDILQILAQFEKTFLFEGCQDFYRKMVPRDSEIVLAHNDAQENNILASLEDVTQVIFIDFEYTAWNPRGMDIANYFSETMLDNAHPLKKGIKYYIKNFIKDHEQEFLIKHYLSHYYWSYKPLKEGEARSKEGEDAYIASEYPKFLEEIRKCLLLNNFFWAIWCLRMLKPEKLGDPEVFNFDFAEARIAMYEHISKLYFTK